jgi:sulfide:quinone oxidoreductase
METLLALRDLCGDAVQLTVASPRPTFDYRAAATLEAFSDEPPMQYDLRAIAADAGAIYRRDAVAAVAPDARKVRLSSFKQLPYDALVLAVGARPHASVPGAVTFRDQRDVGHIRRVMSDVASGAVERLVFAVPGGVSWPLPLYELALMAAAQADAGGHDLDVLVVTPEASPLEAIGEHGSGLVAQVLESRGVRFMGRSVPAAVHRENRLELHYAGSIQAERVVSVPALVGRRISGVPASWNGFVPVGPDGSVAFMSRVYAAGDMTTFPLKQGGVATQQADAIARHIAATIGGRVEAPSEPPVLQIRLVGGESPLSLRIALDEHGRPGETELIGTAEPAAPMYEKVLATHLGEYLAQHALSAA